MNITSMNAVDLMKTLGGSSYEYKKVTAEERAEEEKRLAKGGILSYKGRDIFEHSGDDVYDTSSVTALFKTSGYSYIIGNGDRPSNEQLAEHFGGIGKRLDEAYAQEKFTEQEYDELNASLNEYIENRTHSAENVRAFYQICKEEINSGEPIINDSNTADIDNIFAKRQAKIDNYVTDFFKINRDLLHQMINIVRYGK